MAFKTERWTLANILPVAFVIWIVGSLWFVHLWLHLRDLLQLNIPEADRNVELWSRGRKEAIISQTLTALLVICLLRAIFTDPGSVPESAAWKKKMKYVMGSDGNPNDDIFQYEVKADGQRRFCKWCDQYKPDRCHHCRVCRSCILRMDHHCPWIANCVGFRNHKFFFLLVFYALLNVLFIIATMSESVGRAVTEECSPKKRFLLIFAMTLASIMGILLVMFFAFHVSLMLKATTTIEFCEKQARKGNEACVSYDIGNMRNIRAVLGSNPLLWLLPLSPPDGDGLRFPLKGQEESGDVDAFLLDKQTEAAASVPAASYDEVQRTKDAARAAISSDSTTASDPPEVSGNKASSV